MLFLASVGPPILPHHASPQHEVSLPDAVPCSPFPSRALPQHETYKYRGRVSGRFYTSAGGATALLGRVEAAAARAKSAEQIQREMEAQYVSCNTRWTEAEGGCTGAGAVLGWRLERRSTCRATRAGRRRRVGGEAHQLLYGDLEERG